MQQALLRILVGGRNVQLHQSGGQIIIESKDTITRTPPGWFWAKIDTAERIGTDYRWKYGFYQVRAYTDDIRQWRWVDNGRTGTATGDDYALNTFEFLQGQTGKHGCGVELENLSSDAYDFEVQPITDGVVVQMYPVFDTLNNTVRHWFSAPNGVDGGCLP